MPNLSVQPKCYADLEGYRKCDAHTCTVTYWVYPLSLSLCHSLSFSVLLAKMRKATRYNAIGSILNGKCPTEDCGKVVAMVWKCLRML